MKTTVLKEQSAELIKRFNDKVTSIKEVSTSEEFLKTWYIRESVTDLRQKQLKSGKLSLNEIKSIAIERVTKQHKKALSELDNKLTTICNSDNLINATLTIEFKKSTTWGWNPTCDIRIKSDSSYNYYNSGSISGCGYDKESTAFADAINQSDSFKKLLLKNRHKLRKNKTYGYSINSHFIGLSGGVGVSCYYGVLSVCGYELKEVTSTKTVTVYTISKK